MARVLVAEPIADVGLARLTDAGHEVDVQLDLAPAPLLDAIEGAHALVVRSATQVTADVLARGRDLVAVGRAGIGLDNVDVAAATRQGVMVVNAPQANVLSAAEHTMALLLAQARNVPQAHAALRAGRWERTQWQGVELSDKTLGIVGLGRIGKLVAERAGAFGMRLIAYDPFVADRRAREVNVELVELDELMSRSDFVSVHVAKNEQTEGLIGKDLLARARPGLRIINVARGGIVDEVALAEAIRSGVVAGAALDVFEHEPLTESPLFELDSVVVTPHLGASTQEAQDKAGATIAEQIVLALNGDFVPFAVNVSADEASETVRPFVPLAELLGDLFGAFTGGVTPQLEVIYNGALADYDTRILTLSLLRGLLGRVISEPVSYVNAPQLARERGIEVTESSSATALDYVNLVTVRGAGRSMAATLTGVAGNPHIVMVDDHAVDVPPAPHMLVVRNDDRPGVIGLVGTILGEALINITDMDVARDREGGQALMVLSTEPAVPPEVQAQLEAADGIASVHALTRSGFGFRSAKGV